MTTQSAGPEEDLPKAPETDTNDVRLGRRNFLVAGPVAAATPVLGVALATELASAETAKAALPFAFPPDREAQSAARAMALESLLIEKGIITNNTVDSVLAFFETQMGPFNGAKIVAKAWVDPAFAELLVKDTPGAIAKMDLPKGMTGAEGEHMRAVANSPQVHNLIICTLCSCYPWPVLGLPPYWYKIRRSAPGRRASPARCSRSSGWKFLTRRRSRPGTAAVRSAGLWSQLGRPKQRA